MGDVAALPIKLIEHWKKHGDIGWQPKGGRDHPSVKQLIENGWLEPCIMRFGFEAMDTGVAWTDAARDFLRSQNP